MKYISKSDYIKWVILIGLVVLVLDLAFFNRGTIFSLLVAGVMIYFGLKWMDRFIGKLLFGLGILNLIISILSMMIVKFFILAILIHYILQYAQSRKNPAIIHPTIMDGKKSENLIEKKPLFDQTFFGDNKTREHVYQWNDINIQTAFGDTTVDLSYTVLPKGETVIFIRGLIGNVQVNIPYDIEVSVNHSVIAGKTNILHVERERVFNQSLHFQTEGYDLAEQKVKIFTSIVVGDLEVKRV